MKKLIKGLTFRTMIKIAGGGALFALALGAAAVFVLSKDLPSVEQIDTRRISQSTKIYDRDGKVLLYEIAAGQKRTVVPFEEVPQALKDATVAVEDEEFYTEPAFDWRAIIRALLVNISRGRVLQGGSTITQQLAKKAFLTDEQTLLRKARELILAIHLDRTYSKDQILGFYLNEVPYGPTIYGVGAASKAYFDKSVSDLSLAESALLAALPRAPSYYSPWGSHTKELIARQQFILKKLSSLGKITKEQLDGALAARLEFQPQGPGLKAPHFVIAVQDYLVKKYGEDSVRTGGLVVKTTLNWTLQELAEKVVRAGAERNEKLYQGKNAALVAEDAKTGELLALVGSRDYFDIENEGNFDVATLGLRQPGSALKPFAYLTAFEKGYTPETVVFDVPTEFVSKNPDCPVVPDFSKDDPDSPCFHPQNFDEQFRGPVSLRRALAQSINVPAVKTLYLAGLDQTLATLKNFGVSTLGERNRYGLSLVLGGGEVKLVELVGAYGVLSQEGVLRPQTMILEVRDANGSVLESYKDRSVRVVDPQYPRLVNNILSDQEARAGLFQNSLSLTVFPDHDVALKTGTTNDYRDAWALGYTPNLVVGVWAGNNDNAPMQRHGSSILAAVPIWHDFMAGALKDLPSEAFARPEAMQASKPILRGDYAWNQRVHSILYSVDRDDPVGAPPQNPTNDPQFENWEPGVLLWASQNIPNFASFNQAAGAATVAGAHQTPPSITIQAPARGDFIRGPVNLRAQISAQNPLSRVRIYFNNQLVKDLSGGLPSFYDLSFSFTPQAALLQNLLEVEAVDQNNASERVGVIVYK
ncbi:MAG: Penicillin-binding protein, 1A family [Parcubacteria group bacterium GW2011_GWB1_56_8]|nr:MAG: Penicillin-binding protein, 1A family [Parcubacteria group bacterium GW2011_GWB1_56_8]